MCAPNGFTEHKFKENLQTRVFPVVFNVRKIARGYIHLVAHFLAALFPRVLYRLPESLKIIKWYFPFGHFYSPYYILLFTFLLGYACTVQQLTRIIHNSLLVIIRHAVYNYISRQRRKDR